MKKRSFLLLTLFSVLLFGCTKPEAIVPDDGKTDTISEEQEKEQEHEQEQQGQEADNTFKVPDCRNVYEETDDSLTGVEENDFSPLITAAEKQIGNYVTYNQQFLNEESREYYKINYGQDLADDFICAGHLKTVFDSENLIREDTRRLSKNKYEINNSEAVNSLIPLVCPTLRNEGYFLTFNRVTIELSDSLEIRRVRLFVNTTQIGKLIETHKKQENSNWYLLFAQSYMLTDEEINSLSK